MVTASFAKSEVEQAALAWLEGLGYLIRHGPDIAPGDLFSTPSKITHGIE